MPYCPLRAGLECGPPCRIHVRSSTTCSRPEQRLSLYMTARGRQGLCRSRVKGQSIALHMYGYLDEACSNYYYCSSYSRAPSAQTCRGRPARMRMTSLGVISRHQPMYRANSLLLSFKVQH